MLMMLDLVTYSSSRAVLLATLMQFISLFIIHSCICYLEVILCVNIVDPLLLKMSLAVL